MAVNFILRLHKMHIPGGANGLVKLRAQANNGAVEVPQLLLVPGLAAAQHEGVVAQGLDLQIVVKGGDALQLVPVLVVHHRPEQLPGLAGGSDDEPLPVGRQLRLGDDGKALEIFQVGGRHQLIQVLEPQLVFSQNNNVLGPAVVLIAQGPQLQHFAVDLLQAIDAQLPAHFLKKRDKHIAHHARIIRGTVVVEGRQVQMLRHYIQLKFIQLRQQVLGQNQGVHIGGRKIQPHPAAALPDEADVKLRIVCRQRPPVYKLQKCLQGLLELGCVLEHGVGDARKADYFRCQAAAGIYKGLESVCNLPVFQHHRADLRDSLFHHLQARGLDVKADDLVVKILVRRAVNRHPIVQIVDEIPFHTIENFYFSLGCVPGIGKGLHHAVVSDGDSRMAPGNGLLNHRRRVRQGVHVGHAGMQVQLHPLLLRRILPALMADLHDALGIELHVLSVPGQLHKALDPQPHPRGDGALQATQLLGLHIFADSDRVFVIRHVKGQHPYPGAPGLMAIGKKHLALHHNAAHFGVQPLHGDGLALDGLAKEHLLGTLFPGGGHKPQPHLAESVMLLQQLLQGRHGGVGHVLPALHLRLQGAAPPIQLARHELGVRQQRPQVMGRQKAPKKV